MTDNQIKSLPDILHTRHAGLLQHRHALRKQYDTDSKTLQAKIAKIESAIEVIADCDAKQALAELSNKKQAMEAELAACTAAYESKIEAVSALIEDVKARIRAVEELVSPFACPRCGGSGEAAGTDAAGQRETHPCPACKGTGLRPGGPEDIPVPVPVPEQVLVLLFTKDLTKILLKKDPCCAGKLDGIRGAIKFAQKPETAAENLIWAETGLKRPEQFAEACTISRPDSVLHCFCGVSWDNRGPLVLPLASKMNWRDVLNITGAGPCDPDLSGDGSLPYLVMRSIEILAESSS